MRVVSFFLVFGFVVHVMYLTDNAPLSPPYPQPKSHSQTPPKPPKSLSITTTMHQAKHDRPTDYSHAVEASVYEMGFPSLFCFVFLGAGTVFGGFGLQE